MKDEEGFFKGVVFCIIIFILIFMIFGNQEASQIVQETITLEDKTNSINKMANDGANFISILLGIIMFGMFGMAFVTVKNYLENKK
jgi:CDP-diglyceride synthetase